eukprot:CAMPEP_0169482272 /NCGR_PEP_ID=MMETSP1042-20121227/30588_1 /TAXON_ID=464988 /ORGANISM="Hemiselmis andersenii, Strain CCMP1180" /LENGTH=41 /DNA_ID= /DNA_START= /DNA_END= /DNA_ORIENTATION=
MACKVATTNAKGDDVSAESLSSMGPPVKVGPGRWQKGTGAM